MNNNLAALYVELGKDMPWSYEMAVSEHLRTELPALRMALTF